jgi:hypothetical protein
VCKRGGIEDEEGGRLGRRNEGEEGVSACVDGIDVKLLGRSVL